MANFYLNAVPCLGQITFNKEQDIIVEIGSDQNEGSSTFFDKMSGEQQVPFYSVDVQSESMKRMYALTNVTWQVHEGGGSAWAKEVLPRLDKKIKVLYLDNYDWANPGPMAIRCTAEYAARGIAWSNQGSQVEHLHQMINCLPYMSEQSVVICDDTPLQEHSGIYIGKCSAVVPLLLINGYKIEFSGNNGVVLARGL